MSTRRFMGTSAVMALLAVALDVLTPDLAELTGALTSAQRTADTLGPDAVVVALTGLLAWAVWGWGALGLALTAGSALPGLPGATARGLLQVVVPAGARHGAAVLLGVGVGVAAPLLPALPVVGHPAVASAAPAGAVPDWPAAVSGDPVPDWPVGSPAGGAVPDWPARADDPVVVEGDCLWHLAEADLIAQGRTPTDRDVATAVDAWWTANADVIGPDPDLLLPGQVLQPPAPTEELP